MPSPKARYQNFSGYLKTRFGGPVRKITLDAGFSCPNRDGTVSRDGCVFCNPQGFAGRALALQADLEQTLSRALARYRSQGITRFMAYFQPYSNTHAPVEVLKTAYDVIRRFPEMKALAVGTRPDCLDEERMALLAEYTRDYEVWLELGLQSIHDDTLKRLNRGHDAAAFFRAVELARRFPGVRLCAHVILGLPGESPEHERATAQALAELRVEGVKLHPLHVVTGTVLEKTMSETLLITRDEYVERAGRFLEHLWPGTVIQRLTADCHPDLLVAPGWIAEKSRVIREIEAWLKVKDTWQGKNFKKMK